jgi:hypothetical protein
MVLIFAMLAGCLSARPLPPVVGPVEVSTVVVVASPEHADTLTTPPHVQIALGRALQSQGLTLITIDTPGSFYSLGTTQHRLDWILEQRDGTVLLVETSIRPRGHLGGRYQWQVDATISVATTPNGLLREELTVPVTLQPIHQQEAEALIEAAPQIADRAATMLSRQLRGATP